MVRPWVWGRDRRVSCFEKKDIGRLSIWYHEIKVTVFVGNTFIIVKLKFFVGYQFVGYQ